MNILITRKEIITNNSRLESGESAFVRLSLEIMRK